MDQMSLWCLYCQLWLYLTRCSSLFFYLFVFCFCFCFLMALNVNGGWHTLLPNLYLFYAFQGQISEHSTSPPIFFQIFSNPFSPNLNPHYFFVVLILWLSRWSCRIWCVILLNSIMVCNDKGSTHVEPWHYSTRRTLLCVLCNKTSSLLRSGT